MAPMTALQEGPPLIVISNPYICSNMLPVKPHRAIRNLDSTSASLLKPSFLAGKIDVRFLGELVIIIIIMTWQAFLSLYVVPLEGIVVIKIMGSLPKHPFVSRNNPYL